MTDDIRWWQRLASYQRALAQLQAAVSLRQSRPLSELERKMQEVRRDAGA